MGVCWRGGEVDENFSHEVTYLYISPPVLVPDEEGKFRMGLTGLRVLLLRLSMTEIEFLILLWLWKLV